MFIDVKKAHLNGVVGPEENAYVKMPCDPPGHCRRLRRWLYGMRHAASAGESSPMMFSGFGGDVRCVVHRADFTFLAFEDQLRQVEDSMRSHYSLVVLGCGSSSSGFGKTMRSRNTRGDRVGN